MSAFEELKGKLREIFQLDRTDLDFGLYRVMNLKAEEVSKFIDHDLLPQVKEGLKTYVSNDNIQNELNKLINTLKDAGMNPDESPKVKELKEKLADSFDAEKIENEIYSDLYNFFKRYYSEGDFLSLRRYKEGVYALPYEGEEVKLHWANADQYYIKSGEDLTNYTFKTKKGKVRFEVVEATTEQNNNKDDKNRRFKLVDEAPVREGNGEYVVSFTYLPNANATKQEELNKKTCEVLLANGIIAPIAKDLNELTGSEKNRIPVLLKHLNNFTAKNQFDYFIHKDLGKFLNRELDFYIKNEIMHIDDIENENAQKVEQYLGKVKVLRKVAKKIITFLASLEDFQKKIWLKKKFVLETNYCITLDRIPEKLYPEIAKNEAQRKEWVKLFAIDELRAQKNDLLAAKTDYSEPLTIEFLKENPYLVLDTAFFDTEFKYNLLGSIDNFDEQCDGLMIHSENFQALNLLQEKYAHQIHITYLDPPYNAKTSEIAYKNSYKHSSWLSLIANRLDETVKLQNENSALCMAIDENEQEKLGMLLKDLFPSKLLTAVSCVHNPRGIQGNNFSYNHETYYFSYTNKSGAIAPKQLKEGIWEKFRNWGGNSDRKLGYAMFYPIYFRKTSQGFVLDRIGIAPKNDMHPVAANIWDGDIVEIWPIDDKGYERKWRYSRDTTILNLKLNPNFIKLSQIGTSLQIEFYKSEEQYRTCWFDKDFDASIFGSKPLNEMFGENRFGFPKSINTVKESLRAMNAQRLDLILDYFAGSGTTGHAVINLNREDDGKRKYILVEMGNYFDLVTKPRIEKVIYSKDWKDGKPVSRKGSSHCFKYIRLESYEDALDNLKFERTTTQEDLLNKQQNASIREDYMLKYMMDLETKGSLLNIQKFAHPFDYEMKTTRNGETKTVNVDLIETFNYLIGLNVNHIRQSKGIVVIEGKTRDGEKTLVLWRDTDKVSSEDLDAWFEKQNYSTQDMEFDTIYVNGDNNLENLKKADETWKVRLTEAEFQKRMFDVKDV